MTYCLWEDISDRHIMKKTNLPYNSMTYWLIVKNKIISDRHIMLLNSMTYCLWEDISDRHIM